MTDNPYKKQLREEWLFLLGLAAAVIGFTIWAGDSASDDGYHGDPGCMTYGRGGSDC